MISTEQIVNTIREKNVEFLRLSSRIYREL